MLIAKKYFLFHGLHREKAGLERVRIAKKFTLHCCQHLQIEPSDIQSTSRLLVSYHPGSLDYIGRRLLRENAQ